MRTHFSAAAMLSAMVIGLHCYQGVNGQTGKNNPISNPGFEKINSMTGLPDGWETKISRDEIAPEFKADNTVARSGKASIKCVSNGSAGSFGYWLTTARNFIPEQENAGIALTAPNFTSESFLGNKNYRIGCYFKTNEVENPFKSVWVRVNWLDKSDRNIFTEVISRHSKDGEWYHAEQVLTAPRTATGLSLELVFMWADKGTVWFDDVTIEEAPAPQPRKIKVASSTERPPSPSTTEKNLDFYYNKVVEAGKAGTDIICLGEAITIVSTGKKIPEVAETVPGPTSIKIGEAARKAGSYVVVGIYEREGKLIYNTSLLIDRNGNVAGKYRKTHLPQTEVNGGMLAGSTYPVFRTDFGIVGMEICYDNFFPEVCRQLAVNGAEIILCPIWGDGRGDNYMWDIVARARAIDNGVFFVASMYSPDGSLIIDPQGKILPDADKIPGLITSEIDLNMRSFERWLSVATYGEWENLFPQERRSETYKDIMTNFYKK